MKLNLDRNVNHNIKSYKSEFYRTSNSSLNSHVSNTNFENSNRHRNPRHNPFPNSRRKSLNTGSKGLWRELRSHNGIGDGLSEKTAQAEVDLSRLRGDDVPSPSPPPHPSGDKRSSSGTLNRRPGDLETTEDGRERRRRDANTNFDDNNGCPNYLSEAIFVDTPGSSAAAWMRQQTAAGHRKVHVATTEVRVVVKDINDNAPVFPNVTMAGDVQENGPIDLSVVVVAAWDADDAEEGSNARLTYTIEKNVIEERSGASIFQVDPQSGLIRTALCCLDRETTPEYHIQVVATDGGGLKGIGTVVVHLVDVNDNSPRLARPLWELQVMETWGVGPPDNTTLLQVTALDRDTKNYFFYRVVEQSGWGWQHFGMRSEGSAGLLYATQTLDYEDPNHRRGFRFMVQVTDKGRGGWDDPRHVDSAWVSVELQDVNDNPPEFRRADVRVTVREDTPVGTLLATMPAHDPDTGVSGEVRYTVSDTGGSLTVDSSGGIRLRHGLDREGSTGSVTIATVVARDRGHYPLSATATLTITITDVNDSPPRLLPPVVLHVLEGSTTSLVGILTATDDDVWALGHGPPFTLELAHDAPIYIRDNFKLNYDSHMDSGRGGAELWTTGSLDREQHRSLSIPVAVTDAGGMTQINTVTVIVDDINDNKMKPGQKTVYLWKTRNGGGDASLGRVWVDDPDDWDSKDKSFRWLGPKHPLFKLDPDTGTILASTQLRQGRYQLQFLVSDIQWQQRDVPANVTVDVRLLQHEALVNAQPLTLAPLTPTQLTRGWRPSGGGGVLGRLMASVQHVLGEAFTAELLSVYGSDNEHLPTASDDTIINDSNVPDLLHTTQDMQQQRTHIGVRPPGVCVWLAAREVRGQAFMDPIRLQGILSMHQTQLESATQVQVEVADTTLVASEPPLVGAANQDGDDAPSATLPSTALHMQVVDTNSTSLVTPRLRQSHWCPHHGVEGDHRGRPPRLPPIHHIQDACTPISCLNGGRCVKTEQGNRYVCS
ncbi:unnamed protein product, partial [Meganyctiphanes norvegica]